MTGRPDAGPESAGETRRVCINTDATPAQLRHSAQRLRDHAAVARQLAHGGRAMELPDWQSEEHERNAAAYDKSADALERLA